MMIRCVITVKGMPVFWQGNGNGLFLVYIRQFSFAELNIHQSYIREVGIIDLFRKVRRGFQNIFQRHVQPVQNIRFINRCNYVIGLGLEGSHHAEFPAYLQIISQKHIHLFVTKLTVQVTGILHFLIGIINKLTIQIITAQEFIQITYFIHSLFIDSNRFPVERSQIVPLQAVIIPSAKKYRPAPSRVVIGISKEFFKTG